MKINVNNTVRFKLNQLGVDIWNKYYLGLMVIPLTPPTELPLWEFMQIFGHAFVMGSPTPIVQNELDISRD